MYILPATITTDALRQYAAYLFGRINDSQYLPFKQVSINGKTPAYRNCHENARLFAESNPSFRVAFGWLCEVDGSISSTVEFIAHSVIQDDDGSLYEITPMIGDVRKPFLIANLLEHDFADIVNKLESLSGTATLIHYKT